MTATELFLVFFNAENSVILKTTGCFFPYGLACFVLYKRVKAIDLGEVGWKSSLDRKGGRERYASKGTLRVE
jgi:uncharacterized membrane protein YobD (UPF0266 family)